MWLLTFSLAGCFSEREICMDKIAEDGLESACFLHAGFVLVPSPNDALLALCALQLAREYECSKKSDKSNTF